jgi:hypothetical protein
MGFVWVPNNDLYFELEQKLANIIFFDNTPVLHSGMIPIADKKLLYDDIATWVKTQKILHRSSKLSGIFSSVCIFSIKNHEIRRKSYDKEKLTLSEIQSIIRASSEYDASIALSFLFLAEKYKENSTKDMLVGMILYDLRRKEAICFNIQSIAMFYDKGKRPRKEGVFFDVAWELLNNSIDQNLECKSFVPLPVYSPVYTMLPWFSYIALRPVPIAIRHSVQEHNLTIPEFLTFGNSEFFRDESSFHFEHFSANKSGHATCILKFKTQNRKIPYILRFDQWSGDTFVHLDYSMHEDRESKFIEHHPLDLEQIYQFSPDLFVAVLIAGMFDGHFSSIIGKGLKGVQELVKKNPAYFYPLRMIWLVENAIQWLNEHKEGYEILEKFAMKSPLTEDEQKFLDDMSNRFIGMVATEEGNKGIGIIGFAILHRINHDQTHLRMK